jgi:hypothetical protein
MICRHRRIQAILIAAGFAVLAAATAQAASVTRGPYLQLGTPTSVVARWRTDVATDSRVSYGATPLSLTLFVDDPNLTTEHQVTVSGLSPDTVYYYSIGSTTEKLAGDDANHFILTSPWPATPKPTRIWVLGDSGTANASARAVRDAYYAFTGTRHTDLWLMLGDNAYTDGTDPQYQAAVFNMYPEMLRKSVLWPTLGNHDGHSTDSGTQSGPYYDIFTLPKNGEGGGLASGTEAYYSFDYGNVHFIVLDSFDSDRSPFGAMMMWLQADLATTTQDWIIAYWHHPPYSKGSHDSDGENALKEMRQNALPVLEGGGVDVVLAGHSHSYERSFLLDGHYGTSSTLDKATMILDAGDGREVGAGAYQKPTAGPTPHEGAVYTVAGSSGKTSGGTLNHPVMFVSLNVLGSVVLDVERNRLDATFLDSTGAVKDSYTILKGTLNNNPPAAVDDTAATNEDTPITMDVLSNDSDPDGDLLSVASVTQPSAGSATITAGNFVTYAPAANFNGSDLFTYTASDGRGGRSTATVTVTVNPVNDAPVANNQSVTTGLNTSVAITLQASDVDGDPLTYSVVTSPSNGSLSGTAPNLSYTPNFGFSGSDSFTFKATDNKLAESNVATASITLAPPVATTGFPSPTANAPVTSSAGDKNGFESNPANAHADDGLFAVDNNSGTGTGTSCTGSGKDKHLFYGYNFSIPAGATIKGIEVRLDAKVDLTSGSPKLCVQLSWNGGSSWTSAKRTSGLTTSEATYVLGSPSDLWGRSWTAENFGNTSFRARVISVASNTSRDFSLDWVAVRVTYQQ